MTKKQKKVLIRIIVSTILLIVCCLIPFTNPYVKFIAFMVPYFVIGYDILKKAVLGIIHGEVFDENFLMAVATVGAIALSDYKEGTAVMLFYQIGELFQSYAVGVCPFIRLLGCPFGRFPACSIFRFFSNGTIHGKIPHRIQNHWPAFDSDELYRALFEYQSRDRRFGAIQEDKE